VNNYRVIASDAAALAAPPLEAQENAFRVTEHLGAAGYRHLATRLEERPDAWLSLNAQGTADLECLVHFPRLRRLLVNSLRLESWDGVRHVAGSLEELAMGDTTLKPVSIAPIGELANLRSLSLIGPVRDAHVIGRLDGVEDLSLRSVTLPSLALLVPTRQLRALRLLLGGTDDLRLLPELAPIEELELWRIRGLRDISAVGSLPALRVLRLQSMSAITAVPSLRKARSLRTLALDTMKGVTDLRPVAEAPSLEELLLVSMCQLEPDALRPMVGHPTLRHAIWGLCSDRKNAEAWEILPQGDPPWNYERWKARQARRAGKRPPRPAD
jgi:hypothetical protein